MLGIFTIFIRRILTTTIKKKFNVLGYNVVKKKNITYNKNFNYSKLDLLHSNILLNYKLNNLITTAGKRLGSSEDPYFYALKNSYNLINDKKKFITMFKKKIKLVIKSPRTAGEAVGLENSKKLNLYPEWALVKPWEDKSIGKINKNYLKNFIKKREKLKKLYYSGCNKNVIMYNDLAWESHAEQYYNLHQSISKYGFNEDNLISVNLFKYKNSYRCSLGDDGNHRVRIALILGIKTIPLKISKIVDFDDLKNWTNVKTKLYSLNDAEKIFTDYFNYLGKGAYI